MRDFIGLGVEVTPYDPYEEKLGDQYVNAEILLPRGDTMARGQVVHQKHDADGNPIGRSNQNLILDTCLYKVEFPGREMTELAANIIAESMYAKCDVSRN